MCGAEGSPEVSVVLIFDELYLCTNCIDFMDARRDECLREMRDANTADKGGEKSRKVPTPREINAFLDQYVIGQDSAFRWLSTTTTSVWHRWRKPVWTRKAT